MCTIGTVFDGSTVCTFKQCDLTDPTTFYAPEQRQGKAGSYLAMTRAGKPGLWAGANEQGVSFVAADNYTRTLGSNGASMPHVLSRTSTYQDENDSVDSLFETYERAVADFDTATGAVAYLSDFYLNGDAEHPGHFEYPDIALFSDLDQTIYMEYSPVGDFEFDGLGRVISEDGAPQVRTLTATTDYFASTNNCRLFNTAVTYPMNHSTYLRLTRAELLLQQDPSNAGVHRVLRDQYYGETDLSICRVAVEKGQYYTQASVIFNASPTSLICEYVINGNPRTVPWEQRPYSS